MRVTFLATWKRKQRGHQIAEKLVISDTEAMAWSFADAVEIAVLLHGMADKRLRELHANARTGTNYSAQAEDTELGSPADVRTMLSVLRSASDARPLPEIERTRTLMRAALLKKYVALGIATSV